MRFYEQILKTHNPFKTCNPWMNDIQQAKTFMYQELIGSFKVDVATII